MQRTTLLTIGLIAILAALSPAVPPAWRLQANIGAGLGLLALLWIARVPLVGPMLVYDLVRTARRSRYHSIRFYYGLAVGGSIAIYYLYRSNKYAEFLADHRMLSTMNERLFLYFCCAQYVGLCLLAPAYCAGISEERERNSLEFLLTTDLRSSEIVLGFLISRTANLFTIVLAGLPILGLMQLMGGVAPQLVLGGTLFTLINLASLAALGTAVSVAVRRPRDAILVTYFLAVIYVAGASGCFAIRTITAGFLREAIDFVNWGNPVAVVAEIAATVQAGGNVYGTSNLLLQQFAIFHGLAAFLVLVWAIARFRMVSQKLAEARGTMEIAGGASRPPVFAAAMLWKELFVDRRKPRRWTTILMVASVLAAFAYIAYLIARPTIQNILKAGIINHSLEVWLHGITLSVALLMFLQVGSRAFRGVSTERELQTLDSLIISDFSAREILWSKWLASVLCPTRLFIVLVLIWLFGIYAGESPLFLIFGIVAWPWTAGLLAALCLWYSVRSQVLSRAILPLLLTIVVGVGLLYSMASHCETVATRRYFRLWEDLAILVFQFAITGSAIWVTMNVCVVRFEELYDPILRTRRRKAETTKAHGQESAGLEKVTS